MLSVPEQWRWFPRSRFGLFIHWGPYAEYGRGEQILFREHLDQAEYARRARRWKPQQAEPAEWIAIARRAGMKYAVLTARHHDGYCLWDSKLTEYTSVRQAPKRDYIQDYVQACRDAGLRVGLYYSLADWRIPAYWNGIERDPAGWSDFVDYVHAQVRELLSNYGRIDVIWFDGAWPHTATEWRSRQLIEMMRTLQPNILINNRLSTHDRPDEDGHALGDFGTPEQQIVPEPGRLWETCQVSTWRLWGYATGERWKSAETILDMLVESAAQGGNLLLNVGPDADGVLPQPFVDRMEQIGDWMDVYGEAIYDTDGGEVFEFVSYGWQTCRGNNLYLIIRFWEGAPTMRLAGLKTRVQRAVLMGVDIELPFEQDGDELILRALPEGRPTKLFPVIRLECADTPAPVDWAKDRLWMGDARRMVEWAARGGGPLP